MTATATTHTGAAAPTVAEPRELERQLAEQPDGRQAAELEHGRAQAALDAACGCAPSWIRTSPLRRSGSRPRRRRATPRSRRSSRPPPAQPRHASRRGSRGFRRVAK